MGEIVGGSTPDTKVPKYWGGDIPWLTPKDMSVHSEKLISRGARNLTDAGYEACSTQIVPAGTVVFTSRASIGYAAIAANPLCTNQGFKSVIPGPDLFSDFLYWYLLYATPYIRGMASGTTFLEISTKGMLRVPIPIPTLDEQRAIVAAIETWLSQLDKAHSTLRQVTRKADLLRSRLIETELEDAQAVLVTLGAILAAPLANGRSVPTAKWNRGFPVLRLTAIRAGRVLLSEFKNGAWTRDQALPFLVRAGDFMVVRGNGSVSLVGRGGLVPQDADVAFPDTMIRIRPDLERVSPEYLSYVWDSRGVRRYIERTARTTAGIHKINQTDLERMPIPLPDRTRQTQIVAKVQQADRGIARLASITSMASRRAGTLRSSILSAAFTGRVVGPGLHPQDAAAWSQLSLQEVLA